MFRNSYYFSYLFLFLRYDTQVGLMSLMQFHGNNVIAYKKPPSFSQSCTNFILSIIFIKSVGTYCTPVQSLIKIIKNV